MMKNKIFNRFKKPKNINTSNIIATNNAIKTMGNVGLSYPSSSVAYFSGMTSISIIDSLFHNFKQDIDRLTDDDKVQLLKMINDEYKVLLRKEKLKKIQ
jgi:hypothetical protein